MKLLTVCVAVLAAAAAGELAVQDLTAFDYHNKVGIPAAKRLQEAEALLASDPSWRIIGGAKAALGDHPHQGGLVITLTTGRTSVCGCSLLSDTKALTAAHCWWDGQHQASKFTVVLGSLTLFSGGTRVETNQVVTHGSWNPSTIANDVAVITINKVSLSKNIQPIALPSGNELHESFAGLPSIASGWGKISDSEQITQDQTLSYTKLQIITNAECRKIFGQFLQASHICTSGAGIVGVCNGDSGGPLTVVSNNRRILVGVTSFGHRSGCEREYPSAFSRVSSFVNWINQNL